MNTMKACFLTLVLAFSPMIFVFASSEDSSVSASSYSPKMTWKVGIGKVGKEQEDCETEKCFAENDLLRFIPDGENLSRLGTGRLITVSLHGEEIFHFETNYRTHYSGTNPNNFEKLVIEFEDNIGQGPNYPLKRLTVTPVSKVDEDACKRDLNTLSNQKFTESERRNQCRLQGVLVHWIVETLHSPTTASTSGTERRTLHPEDGQGTATGGN